jgi:NAD(P)-dependent dehydrogenase (short-subunit alcohol dehydrogenase family)
VSQNKTIVISGGMGAVGRAIARSCVEAGWRVAILYHRRSAEEVAACEREFGDAGLLVACDLTDATSVTNAIRTITARYGSIEACVHAAVEPIARVPLLSLSPEEFKRQFEVGFFGAFTLFSCVASEMRAAGRGVLIAITSSVTDGKSGARMGAYTIGKEAVRALMRELNRELSREGIAVFAVAPDLMQTPLTADLPEKYFEYAAHASGRPLTQPSDVARTVAQIVAGEIPRGSSVNVATGEITPL